MTKGQLAALIDDPVMLTEPGPDQFYLQAKVAAIDALKVARDSGVSVKDPQAMLMIAAEQLDDISSDILVELRHLASASGGMQRRREAIQNVLDQIRAAG